jgi:hypothetical protein
MDDARYPYNEVWHTAKLIPAGLADVFLKTRISLSRVSLYRGYTVYQILRHLQAAVVELGKPRHFARPALDLSVSRSCVKAPQA